MVFVQPLDVISAGASLPPKDLFNPEDSDVGYNRYVREDNGVLANSTTYNATGFIPVKQGATYVTTGAVAAQRRAYYDANKVFVAGVYDFNTAAFTIPEGTGIAYMRLTVPLANWETLRVEEGTAQLSYTPAYRGRPLVDDLNLFLLRRSHNLLAGLAFGEPVQFVVNAAGDSYFQNPNTATTKIANYLTARFGDAGGGWCGFGFLNSGNVAPWTSGNQPSFLNGNARPTLYPTRLYGGITSAYISEGMADLASATLTSSGDAVEVDFPAAPTINGVDLHWIGTGAGQIRYTLNGGSSFTTLSVGGTAGTTVVTALSLTGLTQPGTLRIEWVSGSAKLGGVNLKSAASGVRVNKIAASGSNVGGWATATALAGFGTSYQALGGHLFSYMDGPNSENGIDYITWAARLTTIVNRIKSLTSGADAGQDILFLAPPENAMGYTYSIAGYVALARNLSNALRFAMKVIRFGDAGNINEYKSTGSMPLLGPDNLHPNGPGGRLIAADWLKAVLPF